MKTTGNRENHSKFEKKVKSMDRETQIIEYLKKIRPDDVCVLSPLISEMVFLEEKIENLKKFPFIEEHPSGNGKTRSTDAYKQYKELLQQYNNIVKTIVVKTGMDGEDEESPLRAYMKQRTKQ